MSMPAEPTRSWRDSILFLAVIVLATGLVAPGLFSAGATIGDSAHSMTSLDMALARAFCGASSQVSEPFPIAQTFAQPSADAAVPFRELIVRRAGSMKTYCASAGGPVVNNENSLMLIESWLLRLRPDLSFVTLGRLLHAVRIAALVFCCLALLQAGFGVALTAGFFAATLLLLRLLQGALYATYPFVFVGICAAVGVYALTLARKWTLSTRRFALVALASGLVAGFGVNMRSSTLPAYAAIFLVFVGLVWTRPPARPPGGVSGFATVAAMFVAGFLCFNLLWIRPLVPPGDSSLRASHPVAHPLVLGLALPANELSRREGIEWNDEVGWQLAKRVDPEVAYLGPGYERALMRYYASLWRQHPREMAGIYWNKLHLAGRDMVERLGWEPGVVGAASRLALKPLRAIDDGVWWLILSLLLASGGALIFWKVESAVAATVALFSVAAALAQLETALIMPYYFPAYQSVLVLFVALLALGVYQVAVVLAGRAAWMGLKRFTFLRRIRIPLTSLEDLAISVDGRRRPLGRALLYTVLVSAVVLAVNRRAPAVPITPMSDGHAMTSLEMALARSLCGAPSAFSETYRIPQYLRGHLDEINVPMRALLVAQAGSLDAYCRSATQPFVNNENSLMLVESWLISASPDLSLNELGHRLHQLRVAGVIFVTFTSLAAGLSIGVAGALAGLSLLLLRLMHEFNLSVYPFLFVLVGVAVGVYVLADRFNATSTDRGRVLISLLAGVVSGFATNMRTSYLPVYAAMFLLFAAAASLRAVRRRSIRQLALRAAPMLVAFAAAHAGFQWVFIARFLPPETSYNASVHSVAHPLVLSLAQPPNDLSRREGIAWLDESGQRLALRVDPTATYLGPRYDAALFRYYVGLWRAHPGEMARIYLTKFRLAGMDVVRNLRQAQGVLGRAARVLLAPLVLLRNGLWLAMVVAGVALWGVWRFTRDGVPLAWLAGLLSVAALLLWVESAVIYPFYVLNYHNYLAFYVFFLALLGAQVVVNALWRWSGPPRERIGVSPATGAAGV